MRGWVLNLVPSLDNSITCIANSRNILVERHPLDGRNVNGTLSASMIATRVGLAQGVIRPAITAGNSRIRE